MTEEPIAEETADGVKARRSVLGCLGRIVIGVVGIIALIVVIGLIFDQGDSADQSQDGVNAGTAEEYARADFLARPRSDFSNAPPYPDANRGV